MRKIIIFISIVSITLTGFTQENIETQLKSVTIGTQIWAQQNLKTSTFNDGEKIPFITDNKEWELTTSPAYCIVHIDSTNTDEYLYNWFSAKNGKLCPTGWHVPEDDEWSVLTGFIGGELHGGDLKDTIGWKQPNLQANNTYGFSGKPAGYRAKSGMYYNQFTHAFFWTTSPCLNNTSWYRSLGYKDVIIGSTPHSVNNGYSVRCLKNK
jgi:uncharacterized protein (TIGR02145 family)